MFTHVSDKTLVKLVHVDYHLYVSFCRYLILLCHFHPPKSKVHFTLKTTSTQDALRPLSV